MLKANTRPTDDQRAALAMLGFIHGDTAQIDHVMDETAEDPQGPAGLILALAETAAAYCIQITGSEEEAEKQLTEIILKLAE